MVDWSLINIFGEVLKVKFFAGDFGVQIENVLGLVFEVGGGVETVRDEKSISWLGGGHISFGDGDEFLLDFSA